MKLIKEEIEILIKSGKRYAEIANIYNTYKEKIAIFVRKNKISKFNNNYFENIDTEAKAYLLGFIIADGSILRTGSKKGHTLEICVHVKDYNIIELFKNEIAPASKIYYYKKPIVKINICCPDICNTLINKYKIIPNKTYNENFKFDFSLIPSELIRHFIRGFFDGDGSVGISHTKYFSKKENKIKVSIKVNRFDFVNGNLIFLEQISSIIENLGYKARKYKQKDILCYSFHYSVNFNNIAIIYNYFYKDAKFFFPRKKEKFEIGVFKKYRGKFINCERL